MADDKIKQQRDRFLAFSFASADLFLEVGEDNYVSFALGAAKSLTGIDEKKLLGQPWLDIITPADRTTVSKMKTRAITGSRGGPYLVRLSDMLGNGRKAIVTGIKMPGSEKFYLTISFPSDLMEQYAKTLQTNDDKELMDKDTFLLAARDALDLARTMGEDLDLTLIGIDNINDIKKRLGPDKWKDFTDALTRFLNSQSVDGQGAAQVTEGRYSIIHDRNTNSDALRAEIMRLARENDPEGKGFEVQSKLVSADLSSLSDRDTTKALIYTINEFERKGTSLTIETLNTGFKAFVSANAQKIAQFKSMVEQLNFDLHFQPVVSFKTGELSHYEMLSRFKDSGSTQEWIIFGEDIGMAADFDIAVCERAINYLMYKAGNVRTKFAVNLSGQSIQNEQFFKTLHTKLSLHKDLADRLMFEITESTTIQDLDQVNNFVGILQNDGFKVCLDDFGAGSSSFQYLHKLNVDYVKIDGSYTRKILTSDRDTIMLKNLSQMCRDLKIRVIAEKVELEEQADRLQGLGIEYGQGYLFSKPMVKPEYVNKKSGQKTR